VKLLQILHHPIQNELANILHTQIDTERIQEKQSIFYLPGGCHTILLPIEVKKTQSSITAPIDTRERKKKVGQELKKKAELNQARITYSIRDTNLNRPLWLETSNRSTNFLLWGNSGETLRDNRTTFRRCTSTSSCTFASLPAKFFSFPHRIISA
jgi:hypothetical protein